VKTIVKFFSNKSFLGPSSCIWGYRYGTGKHLPQLLGNYLLFLMCNGTVGAENIDLSQNKNIFLLFFIGEEKKS